jgi:hypothetical protein
VAAASAGVAVMIALREEATSRFSLRVVTSRVALRLYGSPDVVWRIPKALWSVEQATEGGDITRGDVNDLAQARYESEKTQLHLNGEIFAVFEVDDSDAFSVSISPMDEKALVYSEDGAVEVSKQGQQRSVHIEMNCDGTKVSDCEKETILTELGFREARALIGTYPEPGTQAPLESRPRLKSGTVWRREPGTPKGSWILADEMALRGGEFVDTAPDLGDAREPAPRSKEQQRESEKAQSRGYLVLRRVERPGAAREASTAGHSPRTEAQLELVMGTTGKAIRMVDADTTETRYGASAWKWLLGHTYLQAFVVAFAILNALLAVALQAHQAFPRERAPQLADGMSAKSVERIDGGDIVT